MVKIKILIGSLFLLLLIVAVRIQHCEQIQSSAQNTSKPFKETSPKQTPIDFKIDFLSTQGIQKTCESIELDAIESILQTSDNEKTAVAICRSLRLVKRAFNLRPRFFLFSLIPKNADFQEEFREEAKKALKEIEDSRKIVESIDPHKVDLWVNPGNWQLDLDQNGSISNVEQYFFWVPKPGLDIPNRPAKNSELPNYYEQFFQKPYFQIDASDLAWALTYLESAELFLNLLLAYDPLFIPYHPKNLPQLVDRQRILENAFKLTKELVSTSRKLKDSLLAEAGDESEWIPNPKQKNTVFPLILNQNTFDDWEALLNDADELIEGKTLLGGEITDEAGKILGFLHLEFCTKDEGIDLNRLFKEPLQKLEQDSLRAYCQKPSAEKPISKLGNRLSEIYKNHHNPMLNFEKNAFYFLRYLYWLN